MIGGEQQRWGLAPQRAGRRRRAALLALLVAAACADAPDRPVPRIEPPAGETAPRTSPFIYAPAPRPSVASQHDRFCRARGFESRTTDYVACRQTLFREFQALADQEPAADPAPVKVLRPPPLFEAPDAPSRPFFCNPAGAGLGCSGTGDSGRPILCHAVGEVVLCR